MRAGWTGAPMFENAEIMPDELPAADELEWRNLDPRYARRLQLEAVLTTAIVVVAVTTAQLMPLPIDRRLFLAGWVAAAILALLGLLWPLVSVPRKGYAIR